jgi:hypothetical protein
MKQLAYVWATGQIGFGEVAPRGSLPLGVGDPEKIKPQCRLAYDGQNWLVPGVPEARDKYGQPDQLAGVDALMKFRDRLRDLGIIEPQLRKKRRKVRPAA